MLKFLTRKTLAVIATIAIGLTNGYSQTDTTKLTAYEDLSLKDLLKVKIVSVSKNTEFLFDAPLSASVLSREEIQRTGCTSIMEALRLVPGIIVREQSNGNYDINLRGSDNVPPNASFDIASTTTLVMIDNRPIYSYLRGGTFWETLPIDINDVERIEVIRGPAAALYGPNAVNGVINIITRQIHGKGLYIIANTGQGHHTTVSNASVGYQSKKFSMIASGNYQHRTRSQTRYYEFNRNVWLEDPEYFISYRGDTSTLIGRFPQQKLAMKKYAANIFLNYAASENIKLNLSAGAQHSMVQKVSDENENTPFSTASSDSRYIDFRANGIGFTTQLSYNEGTQIVDFAPGDKYDFHTFDGNIEYNYIAGDFSLKPGISYKSATYDDTKYSDIIHREGIFNGKGIINTKSASLRAEYKMIDNRLRLVGGLTASKFNYPDATYLSSELAATYKVNKKHLLRLVYSRSPRSSNIFDTYSDQAVVLSPSGNNNMTEVALLGNKNLKLLTANMLEAGYRASITQGLDIDVELFEIKSKNYNVSVQSHPIIEFDGVDTVHETPIIATNLPLELLQQGITISLNYSSKKLHIKPFVTFQQSKTKNYSAFINTPDADIPGAAQNNIYSAMGKEATLKSTPTVYGGLAINYVLSSKINLNMSSYYYSSQTYYHLANLLYSDGIRGIDGISAKLIINANISYEAMKGLHLFCSGKNILNDKSREFFRADDVPFMLLGGINYEF